MTDHLLAYDAFLRAMKENADVGHIFLLGAGASISSVVQSAADCILEWKKNIFVSNNPDLESQYREHKSEAVQEAIQKWLDNEGVYPTLNSPEEYAFYAQKTLNCTRIGGHTYYQNIFIHGGCVHVQENKKEI